MSTFRDYYVLTESDGENSDDIEIGGLTSETKSSSFLGTLQFILKTDYPYDVADNFSRNIISTFLIFPIRYDTKHTLRELSLIEDNFWAEAISYKEPSNLIIAFVNLIVFVFGLSQLFKNNLKIGYACLGFYFIMNISASIFRFSGWRFIMPVDWLIYMIFLLGFFNILDLSCLVPQNNLNELDVNSSKEKSSIYFNLKKNMVLIIIFLFIGSIIPLRELFPVNFRSREKSEICKSVDELISNDKHKNIKETAQSFCQNDSSIAVEGKIIYPRFFRKGWGFYDRPNDIFFGEQDYSRLVFRVLNKNIRSMYLVLDEFEDDTTLPNGAQAIILADEEEYPEAQFLILTEIKNEYIYTDDFLNVD